jgi:hypothetical protein
MASRSTAAAATVDALNGSTSLNLANLTKHAVLEGTSSHDAAASFKRVCGAKPSKATFAKAREAYVVGRMVAAFINKRDNRDPMLITAACREGYALFVAKKSKEAKGSPMRLAYGTAKALLTGICKRAGVANPSANAGEGNKGKTGGKPAKAAKTAKGAKTAAVPTITTDAELRAYVATQRVAMLAVVAKASQGKKLLNETTTAIADAMDILAKLAPVAE